MVMPGWEGIARFLLYDQRCEYLWVSCKRWCWAFCLLVTVHSWLRQSLLHRIAADTEFPALQALIKEGKLGQLQQMYKEWPFFSVTLDMIEMVFAKADPRVAQVRSLLAT